MRDGIMSMRISKVDLLILDLCLKDGESRADFLMDFRDTYSELYTMLGADHTREVGYW